MDSVNRFTTKAQRYARYRWGYAPEAMDAIFSTTRLSQEAVAADIGSGTGLLTRELVSRVARVYAVEPNRAMRELAERDLSRFPSFISVDGRSEATTLPAHSVDILLSGQALHWFEPRASLREFRRILRPEGWFAAVFHTRLNHLDLFEAVKTVCRRENGWDVTPSPRAKIGDSHTDTYLGIGMGIKLHFPQTWQENEEEFIGGILSDSHSPEDTHPAFPWLVSALSQVFDRFCVDGKLHVSGGTDLVLGHLRKGCA
jgi:SAM-dependent methyltransferase